MTQCQFIGSRKISAILNLIILCSIFTNCRFMPRRRHYYTNGNCTSQSQLNSVVPKLNLAAQTPFHEQIAFLYRGENAPQFNIKKEALHQESLAIISGRVLDFNATPRCGIPISVVGNLNLGTTYSREDGTFDLVVNGGGAIVIQAIAADALPIHRTIQVAQHSYASVGDLIQLPRNAPIGSLDLSAESEAQLLEAPPTSDKDGKRQLALTIPKGTSAKAIMPDGTEVPISGGALRVTEFTVGDRGPDSMPASIPPTSGYTYAVELSLDEAESKGASDVKFDKSLHAYVDNFLNFPVGSKVPAGYYDRKKGGWTASNDGLVISILDIKEELAVLDVAGNKKPADQNTLNKLNISPDELKQIATNKKIGQTFWRIPVKHFSAWDFNWPYGPPDGAKPPKGPEDDKNDPEKPNCEQGSTIECETQTLGEHVVVGGTPYSLHYRSNRAQGGMRKSLNVPVIDKDVPPGLLHAKVSVEIAGQVTEQKFEPKPNQNFHFEWDGRDRFGRPVIGTFLAHGTTTFTYKGQYYAVRDEFEKSFAQPLKREQNLGLTGDTTEIIRGREALTVDMVKKWDRPMGGIDSKSIGLGGWTLSDHHTYDLTTQTLYEGTGNIVRVNQLSKALRRVAGAGTAGYSGDNSDARVSQLTKPKAVAFHPDGSLYIADTFNHIVRRIGLDGKISTIAGTGKRGFSGDGDLAKNATFDEVEGIAFDADGRLYIADVGNRRVRMIDLDQKISTIAGRGRGGCQSEGLPATLANFSDIRGIAISPVGEIIIADSGCHKVLRISKSGFVERLAGSGIGDSSGDGGSAALASLNRPDSLAVDREGNVLISEYEGARIRRVDRSGIISTLAGTDRSGEMGDGGEAIKATLNAPNGIAIGPDGTVFIADTGNKRIRAISPQGIITTVAGGGDKILPAISAALSARINYPHGLAVNPKTGALAVAAMDDNAIYIVSGANLSSSAEQLTVPNQDGTVLYAFDSRGKHLNTCSAMSGAIIRNFTYDDEGYLESITDDSNRTTKIERNSDHQPASIVAPDGKKSLVVLSVSGYLSEFTDASGAKTNFEYQIVQNIENGLLVRVLHPNGADKKYEFDNRGKLVKAGTGLGGIKSLARTNRTDGFDITFSSAMGRNTLYGTTQQPNGTLIRTVKNANGLATLVEKSPSGSTLTTLPDGTIQLTEAMPDETFGNMISQIGAFSITTPGKIKYALSKKIETKANIDPFAPKSTLETVSYSDNSKAYTIEMDAAARTRVRTSAEGFKSTEKYDDKGRLIFSSFHGLAPFKISYDSAGRVAQTEFGPDGCAPGPECRVTTYGYTDNNTISNAFIADSSGNKTSFQFDAMSRMTEFKLPGMGLFAKFGYDLMGYLTKVTTPLGNVHSMTHSLLETLASYEPPSTPGATGGNFKFDVDGDGLLASTEVSGGR